MCDTNRITLECLLRLIRVTSQLFFLAGHARREREADRGETERIEVVFEHQFIDDLER